jgi:hypothetical protein
MTGAQQESAFQIGFAVVMVVSCTTLYLVPSIIAAVRGHRQFAALVALNTLLGWTVIGWIGTFAWSLARTPD